MREITLLVKDDVTFNALQSLYSTTSSSAIEVLSVVNKPVIQEAPTKSYLVTFTGFDFELTVEVESSDDDEAVVESLADDRVYRAIGHKPSEYSHEIVVSEVVEVK